MEKLYLLRFIERYRGALITIAGASVLFNVLVFAGSLYMMLVYDTVLPSRSIPSLLGLFAILALAYAFQFVFDTIRSEVLLALADNVQADLTPPANRAAVAAPRQAGKREGDGLQVLRDVDQVHAYLSSSGPAALFDLPWVLVFLVILFVLHWWLGLTALAGVAVLAAIAVWTARASEAGTKDLARLGNLRSAARMAQLSFAETAQAMGMEERLRARTSVWDNGYLAAQTALGRVAARLGGAGRGFRLFLQSLLLTVGALLVMDDKASGGIILASSVLAGRALAPVDQAIANWRGMAGARDAWGRIVAAITQFPPPDSRSVLLPAPSGAIALRDVWVVPPGSNRAVVAGVTLTLEASQALALIGPSAAGKTSLAKALLGIWPVSRGEIRLDGATHDQWEPAELGRHLGYVPQVVELIEGTLAENVARFDPAASSDQVIAAARAAGLHETILAMPEGYDTRLSAAGNELSAGQRQRLGLARALYGEPHLLVLDEANSNLDAAGDAALEAAILGVRDRGGIVVLITHRPATLGPITHVAILNGGRLTDFGERDTVLRRSAQSGEVAEA